ncbi:MAG: hypothetical protein IJZ55_10835 [Lachnospiraceae bacterium]|nr:hypothetical protein [Lachnospiraceae bacterium]
MKKKVLFAFMTISLSLLLFGCGTNTEAEKETDSPNKVEDTTDKVTEPETDETTEPDKEQETEPVTGEKEPVSEEATPEEKESVAEEPAEEEDTPVAEEPTPEEKEPATEDPIAEEKEPGTEEPKEEEKEPEKEEPKVEEKEPEKEEAKTEEKEPVTDKPATEEKESVTEKPVTEENKPATEENKPAVKTYQYAFEGKYWYEEVDYMTYDGVRYSSVVNFYDGTAENGFYKTNEYYKHPYSVVNDCIVYDYGESFYYSIEGNSMTLSATDGGWVRHMVLLAEAEIADVLSKNVIEDQPAEDEFVGDRPVGVVYEFEETYWVEYDQDGEVIGYYYDGTNETIYRGEESSTRPYSVMGNDIVFMEDDFYLAYYYMVAGDSLILTPNDGSMPRHCSKVDKEEFDRLLRGEELPEEESEEEPGEEPDEEETTVEIPSTEGKNFTHKFEGKYWVESLPNEKAMGHFFDGSNHITIYAGEKSTQPYTVKDNRMVYTYDWGTFEVTYYVTTEDEGNYITLYPSDGSMEAYYKEVTKEEFEKLCK